MPEPSRLPYSVTVDPTRSKAVAVVGQDIVICAINLDRSPDRWARLKPQLEATGLPYLRLSAIDGSALAPREKALVDRERFEVVNGRAVTDSETGCYMSHAGAWSLLAGRPERYMVVVEDDAIFADDWVDVLRRALARYRSGTLLKLSFQRRGFALPVGNLGDGRKLVHPLTHEACNAAYLIDRKAAKRFLDSAFPMTAPVDHYVESPWVTGVRTRTIVPALAKQSRAKSTQSQIEKFHWRDRVPTLLYRIKAHSLRWCYNFFRIA